MGVDLWHLAGDSAAPAASRDLVRRVLSRHAPVPPQAWQFDTGPHGRPEIAAPACALRFSVAHTAGMIVVGVCDGGEVGVDVERLDRRRVPLHVADRWFAAAEVAALRALPEPARARRFLELWTLKEAYIKARGLGLALPLDRFAIDLSGPRPRLRGSPALDDDPARWHLTLVSLDEHLVAVATTSATDPTFHDASQVLAGDEAR